MTDFQKRIIAGKNAARRELAALPVGEKLRIVEQMIERDRQIGTTRPAKPTNPVRIARSFGSTESA